VSGSLNIWSTAAEGMEAYSEPNEGETITYKTRDAYWIVVSGTQGDKIFLSQVIFDLRQPRSGTTSRSSNPAARKAAYNRWWRNVSRSLRGGRSAAKFQLSERGADDLRNVSTEWLRPHPALAAASLQHIFVARNFRTNAAARRVDHQNTVVELHEFVALQPKGCRGITLRRQILQQHEFGSVAAGSGVGTSAEQSLRHSHHGRRRCGRAVRRSAPQARSRRAEAAGEVVGRTLRIRRGENTTPDQCEQECAKSKPGSTTSSSKPCPKLLSDPSREC